MKIKFHYWGTLKEEAELKRIKLKKGVNRRKEPSGMKERRTRGHKMTQTLYNLLKCIHEDCRTVASLCLIILFSLYSVRLNSFLMTKQNDVLNGWITCAVQP